MDFSKIAEIRADKEAAKDYKKMWKDLRSYLEKRKDTSITAKAFELDYITEKMDEIEKEILG